MRKSFDDILDECIRQMETSGGEIETVLSRYPEHADELRPHLEVWTSLSAVEKVQASSQGATQGRQRLLTAMARAEQAERGVSFINSLATRGGLSMKFVAMFVTGAALALGITFLTGNLEFGGDGSSTEAQTLPVNPCLDTVLGGFAEPTDSFTIEDILALRELFVAGDLTFEQILALIQDLKTCFGLPPPPPTP